MSHDILLREFKLGSEDKAFVLVGVLRTEGPTAIKAGNKAIILADGSVDGWIGGHCTEKEIVSNALASLRDGNTRTLNLTTCQGGRMDVYLEPYLPERRLVLLGHVPIVAALSRLAKTLNFKVSVVDKQSVSAHFPEADSVLPQLDEKTIPRETASKTYAVVATMGEGDADHVMNLCSLNVAYIGVIAGKKRSSEILSYLKSRRVPSEQIDKVKAPAGIYIRAVTAEEIALSVMAEIVELARSQSSDPREVSRANSATVPHAMNSNPDLENKDPSEIRIDPVCGMTVDGSNGLYSTLEGVSVFFCCEDCKRSFDSDPRKYAVAQRY